MTAVSPVAQLILDEMAKFLATEGVPLTQSDIVRRSGGRLKNSRLHQLLNDPVKRLPAPETIEALALGLRIDQERVLRAYLLAVAPNPAGRRTVPDRVQNALDRIEGGDFDDRTKAVLTRAVLDDWERTQSDDGDNRQHAGSGP